MNDTVTELLTGPVGTAVRVVAGALLVAVALWALTGVRLVGDDAGDTGRRPRRPRLLGRLAAAAVCAAVLVPVAVDPLGTVEWAVERFDALAGRVDSGTTATTVPDGG